MVVKPGIQAFGETEVQILSLAAFSLFGASFVLPALADASSSHWTYAALSLTIIRMLPVAVSLGGSKARASTILFLGWFGPRGLASLVFAQLVTREHELRAGEELLTVALLTVTLSIVAHGISAVPGANWYARSTGSSERREGCEHEPVIEHPLRHRVPATKESQRG